MRWLLTFGVFWLGISLWAVALPLPQGELGQAPSLGEFACQLRAERAKAPSRSVRVFTNDNLPARPAGAGLSVAVSMSPAPSSEAGGSSTSTAASPEGRGEEYFRGKMRSLRAQLELHQRELAVLEQKLSQGQMAYYPNPQKTLTQESTPAFYSDMNKLRQEIAKKKQQIADDEKALDDLRDELRRAGGNPEWLR